MSSVNGLLSAQQKIILTYASDGLSNEDIAKKMGISLGAVCTQISRASAKLGVRNKFQATLLVLSENVRKKTAREVADRIVREMQDDMWRKMQSVG